MLRRGLDLLQLRHDLPKLRLHLPALRLGHVEPELSAAPRRGRRQSEGRYARGSAQPRSNTRRERISPRSTKAPGAPMAAPQECGAAQAADKAPKRKNHFRKKRSGSDFCFLRQLRLQTAVTYVYVRNLVCKLASLSCGLSQRPASLLTLSTYWAAPQECGAAQAADKAPKRKERPGGKQSPCRSDGNLKKLRNRHGQTGSETKTGGIRFRLDAVYFLCA